MKQTANLSRNFEIHAAYSYCCYCAPCPAFRFFEFLFGRLICVLKGMNMNIKSFPVLDLMLCISGYGSDGEPAWVKFGAPAEQAIIQELLNLGQVRKELKKYQANCEAIGRAGHYLVAAATLAVRDISAAFDGKIIQQNDAMQSSGTSSLQSIYAALIQFKPSLSACLSFLKWIDEDESLHGFSVGQLLDECTNRRQCSHGQARTALDTIFIRMFTAFKRILIGWLAFGLLDLRVNTFFVKEPVDCITYFREIFPVICEPVKAPRDFSADLVEKIAQYGYIRKFLGYKSENFEDSDFHSLIIAEADALKKMSPVEYTPSSLETIVANFGNLYSRALYVKIFEECQVHRILKQFHLVYLMALIDVFDDFIVQADPYLQKQCSLQNKHDLNAVFDRCFEGTKFKRAYNPSLFDQRNAFPVEKTADKGFDCFCLSFTQGVSSVAWDCITMEFLVQPPLDWFFHRKAIDRYKRIFRFLFRLKRLNIAFKRTLENLRLAHSSGRIEYGDYMEIFQWHRRFSGVICAVQGYIQDDVIHIAWTDFQRRMRDLSDFIKLVEAHEAFLNNIFASSFIENDQFYKCVISIAKSCLNVCVELDVQFAKPADEEINLAIVHAEMADLNSLANLLLALIGTGITAKGSGLTMLNLRMNFTEREGISQVF
ncbi:uncharacterized protein LOC129597646 [Paramacrobiotus metropolitanus]|uniref:uncharacterized protein LOC129597646 n=1 Tax=Paramacrobiotus metropolitanus TaxID=2943436 RepID=UPI002445B52E|nr:uncharacterized protein LOC129597646 [Paramacrobiotus metropolitanus]